MKSIPTSELLKQLNNANNLDEYFKQNQEYFLDNTISEYLYNVFAEKCLVKSRVFRKAEIDEIYGATRQQFHDYLEAEDVRFLVAKRILQEIL